MITMYSIALLLLLPMGYLGCQEEPPPRVVTKLGPVVGTSRVTETGKQIYSFSGIPYTKPPVGELRFKPPQPAEPWTSDLQATDDSIMCVQNSGGLITGTEDCVVLNVHTLKVPAPRDDPLPVMVYIHGGGFVVGSGNTAASGMPDYLLEHDVILVTINYRLGILGFLSTEDEVLPGNNGLLDQVEALKWVKNNIAEFGGNPDGVTIFGQSAGSGSVHYHILSPLSAGLFHRAILQSGVSITPWGSTKRSKVLAERLGSKAGCPVTSSEEMIECLRKLEAEEITGTDVIEEEYKFGPSMMIWQPRIDSESKTPFLPEHSITLMESGRYNKVPTLMGHLSMEGGSFLDYPKEQQELVTSEYKNNWDNSCKVHMAFREFLVPEDKGSEWCAAVKDHFIDSEKPFEDSLWDYAVAINYMCMNGPVYKATELMSQHGDIYSYMFNYWSETASFLSVMFAGTAEVQMVEGNVAHGDDLIYLFYFPATKWTTQSPEYKMVQTMTKLWTDFARTGVPTIPGKTEPWPKASWPTHRYVKIDTTSSIEENYEREHVEFINEIHSNTLYRTNYEAKPELQLSKT